MVTVEQRDVDHELVVAFANGDVGRFHYFWLRDHCPCQDCTHPSAWERTFDMLSEPVDIIPVHVDNADNKLTLQWPGGHHTAYTLEWLHSRRLETEARRSRKKHRASWMADDIQLPDVTFGYAEVMSSDDALRQWLEVLDAYGISLVRGVPTSGNYDVTTLAERVSFLEESHFGRTFDVKSKPSAENLAYTSDRLLPHNDQPSRTLLPGFQFLHCVVNDAVGGESILVDSLALVNRFKALHPAGFELLSTLPVRFSQRSEYYDVATNDFPVITLDRDGEVLGTRINVAMMGTVDVSPDVVEDFYTAFRQLLQLAQDPDHQLQFRMEAGDCQVFHNARILHARAEFDANSGQRHLQGLYITVDDFESRLRLLQRKGQDFRKR